VLENFADPGAVLVADLCRSWDYAEAGAPDASAGGLGFAIGISGCQAGRHSSVSGLTLLLSEQCAPGMEAGHDWKAPQAGQDGTLHRGIPRLAVGAMALP